MRGEEHIAWKRDFPVRHLLVWEDVHEEEPSKLWGRCAEVEGLFMDPPPLPREILTLRGCPRESLLAQAVVRPAEPVRLMGDVNVTIYAEDHQGPTRFWDLEDTVVLAHQPTPADSGRVDIVVGAGVREDAYWGPNPLPDCPRFELWAEALLAADPVGSCLAVDGLFVPRPQRPGQSVHLIGCEPGEALSARLGRPRTQDDDLIRLWALDHTGRTMAKYELEFRITEARPSVLGDTLIDITLADTGDDRPAMAARPVWDRWFHGAPTKPNQWAPFGTPGRSAWLDLSRIGPYGPGIGRSGGTYHLDGQHVTDKPGLLLALGEALLGPGFTYGGSLDSVDDHLGGGPSVVPPFTLIWHHADIARHALARHIVDHHPDRSYFEAAVRILQEHGVTVVLQ
ncbi:barstar family protein [Streptomyces yangpuensis]|uniref:barstar family protein n=1 Tax=Streptomyces yangpuensis TaxID=1648182 RepID=UPI00365D3F7D